jgi:hypothetical protein
VNPLLRFRLRALRIRLLDRAVRRFSRRHRLLAFVAAALVANLAREKVLWRGTVEPGASLLVSVRDKGSLAPGAD